MPALCRVGDLVTGTCTAHQSPRRFTAQFSSGSPTVLSDGKGLVRVGDTGPTDCGHTIQAIVGAPTQFLDGRAQVRVGDPVIVLEGGDGVVVGGAPTNDGA